MDFTIPNPSIPYIGTLPGPLNPGQIIRIQGIPSSSATCFAINLQNGARAEPRSDVALHLSPVFSPPPRLVRNAIQNQQWGPEESHGSYFPFTPGQGFEILVLAESDHFKIAVNGQHFTEFRYRLPLSTITHLAIDGDVTIEIIKLDSPSAPPSQPDGGSFVGGFVKPDTQRSVTPPPPAYGAPSPTYGAPPPTYGARSPTYGAPQPPYVGPPSSMPPFPPGQHSYPHSPSSPYAQPSFPPQAGPYPTQPYPTQSGAYPMQNPYPSYPGQQYPGGTSVVYPVSGDIISQLYPAVQPFLAQFEGSEKQKSSSGLPLGSLAAGAAALAGAAGTALMGGKHGGKHSGKHGGKYGGAAALLSPLTSPSKGKGSSPIPIGGVMAGGAAALAGAYMLSKSPIGHMMKPKKMKKLYKHKHKLKGGWKGYSSSSSSSSSEEE